MGAKNPEPAGENERRNEGNEKRDTLKSPGPIPAPTAGGAGGKGTAKEKQGQGILGLAVLGQPKEIPVSSSGEERKKRGRPKKMPKNGTPEKSEEQISALLSALSLLACAKFGPIWELKEEEIKSIARPLASILDRHDLTEATNEYGDYVALFTALILIFVPRYVMWRAQHPKSEKIPGKVKVIEGNGTQRQGGAGAVRPATNAGKSAPSGPSALKSAIAAIVQPY